MSQVVIRQLPLLQSPPACAGAQGVLQPPQSLFWSSARSQPFSATPSQSPKPGSHSSCSHSVPLQVALATCGSAVQSLPHCPQLRASAKSASQPVSASVSQSPKPAWHTNVHSPSLQP